jgi:aspartate/methionine/tyrosine aminotransferase
MTTVTSTQFRPSAAVGRVRAGSLRVPEPPSSDEIISLAMGEPGFDTPPGIRLTAHGAIEAGYTHYAHPHGDAELREALAERLCQTFSKAYAMTGWRTGYLAGPSDVIAAAARAHATIIGPLNPATQRAALGAVLNGSDAVKEMRRQYRARRDLMVDGLARIDGLHLSAPDGAFYAFPQYDYDLRAVDMVAHLRGHGVAVRPGTEFGRAGEHHIRLSFAAEPSAITTGLERIQTALDYLETHQ